MTSVLHLPARPDASIACDMSTARDTPGERFAEYRELFERALRSRERRADSVVLSFRAEVLEQVEDLVRREHACCPFLEYRVDVVGDEVTWTTTNPIHGAQRAAVDVILDALHQLPEQVGAAGAPAVSPGRRDTASAD